MAEGYLIKDVTLVNEGEQTGTDVLIKGDRFEKIAPSLSSKGGNIKEIDGSRLHLFPGLIDIHLHFREPGLEHKADIYTDSRAAVAGGITSFCEMPNTHPPATTVERVREKYRIASQKSAANYGFYIAASNENYKELKNLSPNDTVGIKIFQGSSTGNLLLNDPTKMEEVLGNTVLPITVHAEEEEVIASNLQKVEKEFEKPWPHRIHKEIRDDEGCYRASSKITEMARKLRARLHVLHLTTGREIPLFDPGADVRQKQVTTEVCPHHLFFEEKDYEFYGGQIKCNPAIKTHEDRMALIKGLQEGSIDMISSDHAPHLLSEKEQPYLDCPAGIPNVQYSFNLALELWRQGHLSLEGIAQKMAHNQSLRFGFSERGFVREGYFADAVLVDLNEAAATKQADQISKCGWSPFIDWDLPGSIQKVWVNGALTIDDKHFTGLSDSRSLKTS